MKQEICFYLCLANACAPHAAVRPSASGVECCTTLGCPFRLHLRGHNADGIYISTEFLEQRKSLATIFFFYFYNWHQGHQFGKMPNPVKDITLRDETTFSYIFEQNVTIELKDKSGLVRCNVYRPKTSEAVPVLVTYGPYGKDISYEA